MPQDNRRLPVPNDSKSPLVYIKQTKETLDKKPVDDDGKRQDGRTTEQLRPVFVRSGVITQAKGSAYIEMNNTKVICAVYGPRELVRREDFSMKGQLQCELKFATFSSTKRGQHMATDGERELSRLLQEALEPAVQLDKFPKARMDLYVTVLENDGSGMAAAINCASVALAEAGIDMYDMVTACSMAQCGQQQLLDPTASEEQSQTTCDGQMLVGYMPSLDQVAAFSQQGNMDITTVTKGMKQCIEGCQRLYPVLQQCLVRAVENRVPDT